MALSQTCVCSNGDTYVGQYVKGTIAGPGMMLFKDTMKASGGFDW